MDYEEKYKAALERAEDLLSYKEVRQEDMEYIFPELKESENEQIRRHILCYFEHYAHDIKGADAQKWIDWLKKQKNTPDKEYVFRPLVGDTIEKAAGQAVKLDGNVVLAFNGAYIPVGNKTKDEIVAEYLNWVKKQGEQTHATKTNDQEFEPKFHPGDWVVNKFGDSWHIDSFDKKNYQVSNEKGNCNWFPILKQDEMHLWTIQDAKDGDILADKYDNIGIFQERVGMHWYSYIYLGCDGELRGFNIGGSHEQIGTHPVTKEQHELLFQKIKEACCEWDAEKKELRKIEPKHVDKIEPRFHEGQWIIRSAEGFKHNTYLVKEIKDYYVCEELKGRRVTFTFNDVHKNFKLWDISDAKDGDVLAINWNEGDDSWEKIIIFKKYHNKGVKGLISQPCVEGYGNTFKNGKLAFQEKIPYYSKTWTANLHPATKKQRDLLFQTIKDAGYEWDIDKKELKKIEAVSIESYYENVRKNIIELVKQSSEVLNEQNQKDMLNWLEKQGQDPKKVSIWKHWKDGICGNGEGKQIFLIKMGNTYSLSSCLGFECDYIELSELDNLMLEKQGHMLDPDKVIEWFRVNWWDNHIGDPIDKFKKDFEL